MEVSNILKWGLLAIAAVFALRWVSSLMASIAGGGNVQDGGNLGPQYNGYVVMGPRGVYPDYSQFSSPDYTTFYGPRPWRPTPERGRGGR